MIFNYLKQDLHLKEGGFRTLELSKTMENYVSGYNVMMPKVNEIIPYHTHKNIEHVIVVKGSVRFNIEEELTDVYQDQLLIINAGMVHSLVALEFGTMIFVGFRS